MTEAVTRPKSAGVSSRARTIVATTLNRLLRHLGDNPPQRPPPGEATDLGVVGQAPDPVARAGVALAGGTLRSSAGHSIVASCGGPTRRSHASRQ